MKSRLQFVLTICATKISHMMGENFSIVLVTITLEEGAIIHINWLWGEIK